jgi:phosphoglucomutase
MSAHSTPGQLPDLSMLIDVPALLTAYAGERPDPNMPEQRVSFGTSGHRGSPLHRTFNEAHILAITQAICRYRQMRGITGPLFLGMDTHAVSRPAWETALEVLAANGVDVMIADGEWTPTPALSHAILVYNRGRRDRLADGIVITPSHNPPEDGGFKYNPPNGGPADTDVTGWIGEQANRLLADGLRGVRRVALAVARKEPTTHPYDYLSAYVRDLPNVIDLDTIRSSGITLGVDPLGGASVRYWQAIAERYSLNLTVVNTKVDPTFRFTTVDWDGRIRMDPSSPDAMQSLIGLKGRFDVAVACDTDADRHGVVTRSAGLLPPNHYLSVMVNYLFTHRPDWRAESAVGKTVVSSTTIDRVTANLGRRLYEVPVGFKWFVDGLVDGSLGFGGEESASASFLRRDGTVWTTDKDGIVPALLAAEITARTGRDPGQSYRDLAASFGDPVYQRTDAPANARQKAALQNLSPEAITASEMAGERIEHVLTRAPGNDQSIGGLKVVTCNGWFAARPSGTEDVYKIYAESFLGPEHLKRIQAEARQIVSRALQAAAV